MRARSLAESAAEVYPEVLWQVHTGQVYHDLFSHAPVPS